MATRGVELASAYISLNVNTENVGRQIRSALEGGTRQARTVGTRAGSDMANGIRGGIASHSAAMFSSIERSARSSAARIGTMMAATLRATMTTALGAVGLAGGGLVGAALFSGLDRLKVLESAKVQLGVMKKSAGEIKQITDDVLKLVSGTPIGLDKAMQAVPQALGAGVKQGKELVRYLEAIGNMSAATGGQRSFQDIAMIMGQITRNKSLALEDLKQLAEGGVDLRSALQSAFNWDDKTFDKKLKDHKITLEDIETASEKAFGTGPEALIKKMGNTFEGAVSKMHSSIARVGANFLNAIFGSGGPNSDPLKGATDGVNNLTDQLGKLETWINTNGEDIHSFFSDLGDVIGPIGTALKDAKEFFDWMDEHVPTPGEAGKATRDWVDQHLLGLPQANAAAPGAFNPGPTAPNAIPSSAPAAAPLPAVAPTPTKSVLGSPIYSGPHTEDTGGAVQPRTAVLENIVQQMFPGAKIGNDYRQKDGFNEHSSGEAADILVNPDGSLGKKTDAGQALGDQVNKYLLDHAAELGIQYTIWQGKNWHPDGSTSPNGGQGVTGGHWDHVHARVQPGALPAPVKAPPAPASTSMPGSTAIDPTGGLLSATLNAAPSAPPAPPTEQLPFGTPKGGTKSAQDAVRQAMLDAGFTADSWDKLDYIIKHESNYNTTATNPKTGDWGIPQFNPAAGNIEKYIPDRSTDPYVQGKAMMQYIKDRYGSIEAAYDFKKANGWYKSGGGVRGPGTGHSDSIPAMLSNGEHVLTADDVQRMGGQNGVYNFRSALRNGLIPGFDDGGAVDPNVIRDAQNNLQDLIGQSDVSKAQLNEILNNPDSDPTAIMRAQQAFRDSQRAVAQAQEALPYIASGQTAPDHGPENRVYSADDAAAMSQAQLDALKGKDDVSASQLLQAQYAADAAKRDQQTARDDYAASQQKKQPNFMDELLRTKGFIPANAGNTGVAGTSSLAGFLNMGNDIVGGLIDTGASLAQTAVSAGLAAGTFGGSLAAGPAAGAAASYGIQLGATQAKRLASYGFQMLSIGADALVEQLFPFGAPRWLGYDYTGFAPKLGVQQALLTTAEKAGTQAIGDYFNPKKDGSAIPPNPAGPVSPTTLPGSAGEVSAPTPGVQGNAGAAAPAGPQPMQGPKQLFNSAPTSTAPAASGPAAIGVLQDYILGRAKGGAVGIYDSGGLLEPGQMALNTSRTPEPVLTGKQWDIMRANASQGSTSTGGATYNVYAQDVDDAMRKLKQKERLNVMQYAGRP